MATLISLNEYNFLLEQHRQKECELRDQFVAARKAFADHRANTPRIDLTVFAPLMDALCERAKERGLYKDPAVVWLEGGPITYAVHIHEKEDRHGKDRLEINITHHNSGVCYVSKNVLTPQGLVPRWLNLDPDGFDLDAILDFANHYISTN